MRIYLSRPRPHRKTSGIQDRSEVDESQRSRLIQAMPKLSLTFFVAGKVRTVLIVREGSANGIECRC